MKWEGFFSIKNTLFRETNSEFTLENGDWKTILSFRPFQRGTVGFGQGQLSILRTLTGHFRRVNGGGWVGGVSQFLRLPRVGGFFPT